MAMNNRSHRPVLRARMSHQKVFTVVEIIVCTVILLALVAITIPVISAAKSEAKGGADTLTLRQIGHAA